MKRFIFLLVFLLPMRAVAADIAFLVIDNNSFLANRAVAELDMGVSVQVAAAGELEAGGEPLRKEIDRARVIVVDVMGFELENFLTAHINFQNKTIYGLRGSIDDERLEKQGFRFDPQVAGYYRHTSKENMQNMLRLVANRHFDKGIDYGPVRKRPELGIYHPKAERIFATVEEYQQWQEKRVGFDPAAPAIGLLFFSSFLTPGQERPIPFLIERLEAVGFNVLPCFGRDLETIGKFLLDSEGRARVEIVLAYTLKFSSALTPDLAARLRQLNVPIVSAINLYGATIDEWRQSPIGIGGSEVAWAIANPEVSGLIEPTPLSAKKKIVDVKSNKTFYVSEPIAENTERLVGRLKSWVALKRKGNGGKRIAIMFYNHHQGKQNIGAAYLNVFRSLAEIIKAMAAEGYRTGVLPTAEEIKRMILASARNIGSWAPGELERLLQAGEVIRLPMAQYKKWFSTLPADFQEKVVGQWGDPESSQIMKEGNDFIIPAVTLGNLVLLPEPARGFGDDPMKLYHDTTLYPHHQYIAAYLWLQHAFKADAMIHLGTHATYEWTPGKQAGLSPSCPPEVLIGDIPNIYPYIVDDVGEGIQAKRRGRGVVVSYLTPALKKAGLADEYARMAELIGEYERAEARASATAVKKREELMALAERTGILKDLEAEEQGRPGDTDDLVQRLGHYLEEIRENLMPYGMHTFGKSPAGEELAETAKAVHNANPDAEVDNITGRLQESGRNEIASLLAGLEGRYVAPGQGNDPVRNPEALPTGRNFYGFNPARLPSLAAWELGKEAAEEIIANHLAKHEKYPAKVGVVLWATETLRNEGVNEATILFLMGIRPRWSKTGMVTGVAVIPGRILKRPRIDVMINASGLYRDLFPDKMEFLDRAVQLAIRQTDIDNLIAANSVRIKKKLLTAGVDEKEAEELSRLRVFSQEPGSYGNGVDDMASASGFWQEEREVVDVYENRMGFAFGRGRWGVPAKKLLKDNLAGVEVAIHSRSSNVLGLLDTDDMFMALGGLSMAVRLESGATPETLISRQLSPGEVNVEDLGLTLGREMRSRYLNRKWIEGMKKEDYAGAREMARYVEYLWGWNMTNPEKVDAAKWRESYEVYVEDRYGLELEKFFNKASPWAFQSITGRMLETVRKGYWQADEKIRQRLAVKYAVSVIEKGVACCDHTCNNPLLNQMVLSIISLPGMMSPDLVEQFKLAVEQAAGKTMAEQVTERKSLREKLTAPDKKQASVQAAKRQDNKEQGKNQAEVEGYKMEKIKNQDETRMMTSSGVEWLAGLAVLVIVGLAAYGAGRRR